MASHDHHDTDTPGTIHLVDFNHTIRTKCSKAHKDIVLVPTPSEDPNDPLNCSPRRKLLSLICMCVYCWFTGICNAVVYSVETPLSSALNLTIADINAGTGYLFLLCGWSLLFWVPFALQFGERPTYLLSTLGTIAFTLWGPYAKGRGQRIAKNVLGGFFAAPLEAIPALSVADVFFAHERGKYMGVYAFVAAGSNFLGRGGDGCFFYPAILCFWALVFLVFFLEETNFERKRGGGVEEKISESMEVPGVDGEKNSTTTEETSCGSIRPYKMKTYLQKLALWDDQSSRPQRMLYRALLSLRLLFWPVVFYAGFSYGSYVMWFTVLNGTASLILSSPPYNFSSSLVGLSYLASIVGVIAATLHTGYLSDWMTLKLARRNNGIFEPEQRLYGFTLCLLVLPASLLLWGVGAAHRVHWFGLIVAMCGTAFCNVCGMTLSVNYLVDSYPLVAGDGMATVIIIRNTMSFAIGYGITPWLTALGTQNCFVSAASVGLAACSVFLVMIWKGKSLRERSREKYWGLVRKHVEMGILLQ